MTTLPYGSWPSPLSAEEVTASAPRVDGARFVGDDIWWGMTVPAEAGRTGVFRRGADGEASVVLPAPWNARSRVHEYGGGSWAADAEGRLLFVEKADQRVWVLAPGAGEPEPLTPPDSSMRFGGLVVASGRLLAVREDHRRAPVPVRDIVEIPLDGRAAFDADALISVAADSDFLAQPALSADGSHLAWVAWDHPSMPWDTTELRVGRLEDGVVVQWATVAGGASAPLQPTWIGENDLLYSDDPTGRWNLWRLRLTADLRHSPVAEADADTGGPLWVLGLRWYGALDDGRIVAVRTHGRDRVVVIDPATGVESELDLGVIAGASIEDVRGTRVLVAGTTAHAPGLWVVDVDHPADPLLVHGGTPAWEPEWTPIAREVTVDGPHGPVHAFDFPPTNPVFSGADDEKPPYIVLVHGGPTSHVGGAASGKIAYFTSRGIGVLDVNYGGSTGYGRAYRERLRGMWGVVDVDDVAAVARGHAGADPARIAIDGGSAGGWTVLCAIARTDAFSAGISRYGVGDARTLATDTHDFEARYLDGLIGPLPEAEGLYIERSPLTHADGFDVPMLLLQGAEDAVVPPSQAEAIRDALASRGVPHAYVLYPGEGHGFRRAETVVDALESELSFLGAVFGFAPSGIAPLDLSTP
ncbi:prolyl oligopeptidase family serine peptidase [Microbacterium awajiense]|uniref:Prolyl oligopeptidase family serine peptidase n=1 Tax=Microbacterium awajiense TaxID=415214 RepID=A0ABP7A0M6_9MICO